MPRKKDGPPLVMSGIHYRDGTPVRFPPPRKATKRNPLLRAEQINDFRLGIDRVVRFDGCCYIVPGDGPHSYEPVQVQDDVLTDQGRANLEQMTPEQLRWAIEATRGYAFLSEEGRRERLEFIACLPPFVVFFSTEQP